MAGLDPAIHGVRLAPGLACGTLTSQASEPGLRLRAACGCPDKPARGLDLGGPDMTVEENRNPNQDTAGQPDGDAGSGQRVPCHCHRAPARANLPPCLHPASARDPRQPLHPLLPRRRHPRERGVSRPRRRRRRRLRRRGRAGSGPTSRNGPPIRGRDRGRVHLPRPRRCSGWHHLPQQEPGRGRRDIADALLFLDEAAKAKRTRRAALRGAVPATAPSSSRTRRGTRRSTARAARAKRHHRRCIRYLSRAEASPAAPCAGDCSRAAASGASTGRRPRPRRGLHRAGPPGAARPAAAARAARCRARTTGCASSCSCSAATRFVPEGAAGRTFLDDALAEGRHYEQRITAALSRVVFDEVFPALVSAVGARGAAAPTRTIPLCLREAREAALRLLYRLLFLLYAEDRDLLPVRPRGLPAVQPARAARGGGARRGRAGASSRRGRGRGGRGSQRCSAPSRAGDAAMGLPPYNGGLFDDAADGLLARLALPDAVLAPLLDTMSPRGRDGRAPLDQLPRPLRAASRLHLRAPAGARPGAGRRGRRRRCAPTPSRARPAAPTTRRTNSCS